mmetsp:Transcript_118680/g.343263  ORF Transcript_118680/g.343263 Transcript_118680/m.343263 type:complete len:292 (+) Transcript_118680:722-1597(+)
MANTTSRSASEMSIAFKMLANSSFVRNPFCNSSKEIVPLRSVSICLHNSTNLKLACANSFSFLTASSWMLISRASLARSTMTARMRFITAKPTLTSTVRKNKHVSGLSSMIGMVTVPQLSPATISCVNVSIDCCTDSKARGHRSQPMVFQTPRAVSSLLIGWMKVTAQMDQNTRTTANMTVPHKIALVAKTNPFNIKFSSGNNAIIRTALVILNKRAMRNVTTGKGTVTQVSMIVKKRSAAITTKSKTIIFSPKNFMRETYIRVKASVTYIVKTVKLQTLSHAGGGKSAAA